tara:strand:- start:262 stop:603 length:342 start_codon:yes stop_codon:yes gene_type:complete
MSESITLTGKVETILDKETFASGFTKRVLVINDGGNKDGNYEQLIPVEFVKDQVAQLDNLQTGQPVSVSVNIRGNEYNGKYYANIQGWRIQPGELPGDVTTGKDELESDQVPF